MIPTKSQRWLDLIALLLGRRVPLTVEEIMERVPAYAAKWRTGDATRQATARRTFERDKDDLRAAGIPLEPVRYAVNYGAEQVEGYRLAHGDFYLPYLRLMASAESEAPPPTASPPGPGSGAGGRGPARTPSTPSASAHVHAAPRPPALRPYAGLASLELSATEAEMALEALRRVADLPAFPFAVEARSALRKLGFDLDPERFPAGPVLWVDRPGSREVLERLRALSDALLARKRVRFVYHGIHRGTVSDREVEPYGLFFQRDWYLVARDPAAGALRTFRVSRMEEVHPNTTAPKSPDFEIPSGFALRDHVDRSAWELGQEDEALIAEVRFRFPLSLQVARSGEGEPLREESDGATVRAFRVSRRDPFLRWILSLAGEAEILTPPELREGLEQLAQEVAALHDEEAATHG